MGHVTYWWKRSALTVAERLAILYTVSYKRTAFVVWLGALLVCLFFCLPYLMKKSCEGITGWWKETSLNTKWSIIRSYEVWMLLFELAYFTGVERWAMSINKIFKVKFSVINLTMSIVVSKMLMFLKPVFKYLFPIKDNHRKSILELSVYNS